MKYAVQKRVHRGVIPKIVCMYFQTKQFSEIKQRQSLRDYMYMVQHSLISRVSGFLELNYTTNIDFIKFIIFFLLCNETPFYYFTTLLRFPR